MFLVLTPLIFKFSPSSGILHNVQGLQKWPYIGKDKGLKEMGKEKPTAIFGWVDEERMICNPVLCACAAQ